MRNRIELINCNEIILKNILQGDKYLSILTGYKVTKNWSINGKEIFRIALDLIKKNPESAKWWIYLPIDINNNLIIGNCGFKGIPNKNGIVEIGYEIAGIFQNQGFATEMISLLVEIAFNDKAVSEIQAHTLNTNIASITVLEKNNFILTEEIFQKGKIQLKWLLKKK